MTRQTHPFRRSRMRVDDLAKAVQLIEANLEGEHWFLERVRSHIKETTSEEPNSTTYPNLMAKSGHDNLIQIAQFFFFLEALDCSSPDQVCDFIESHNRKILDQIESGQFIMRENEMRRAIFKVGRMNQVRDTISYYKRPVFAIGEIGDLLFDLMSPKTTEKLVKELVVGGVLRERGTGREDPPPTTDPRRVLVEAADILLWSYTESLLRTRRHLGLD